MGYISTWMGDGLSCKVSYGVFVIFINSSALVVPLMVLQLDHGL